MSAIAVLLKEAGYHVTGSDEGLYPPASEYLRESGITVFEGYTPQHIPDDTDWFIIGRNAKLDPSTNAEVRAALESGKPVRTFPEVLGELGKKSRVLVVAGSYGKSTSTTLIAWCLASAGKDPSYFIGAFPFDLPRTARLGSGNFFVMEGDEYPTSHQDPRSKFLHLGAHDVLLTGAVHDHVNVFPTADDYERAFVPLIAGLPEQGVIVAARGEETERILAHAGRSAVMYGIGASSAGYAATDIRFAERSSFVLRKDGAALGTLETVLLGSHNIENIVGAAAMLLETGALSFDEISTAVATCTGVRRRLDLLTPDSSVRTYEGFGSSYEKARAAIKAMRLHFPERRLVIIFEPHTFSWRNRNSIHWYDTVFAEASRVLVYEPARQGSETHAQLNQAEIVNRLHLAGVRAEALDEAAGNAHILQSLEPGDVALILSSGNLGGILDTLPAAITAAFPKSA